MASSNKRYTRRNRDPDPKTPVEYLERILKTKKQGNQQDIRVFQRSISLSSNPIKIVDGIKFDLKFEQSLFRSKSDSNLSELVIDIPELNTFVPKKNSRFSKKDICIFWEKEVKRKLEYLEQHKDSSPLNFLLHKKIEKLSKDSQSISSVNTSKGPNQ